MLDFPKKKIVGKIADYGLQFFFKSYTVDIITGRRKASIEVV